MAKPDSYMLDVGHDAADRLTLLNQIYGPFSRAFLSDCGLRPGMTVLDVGCGTGTVTAWIATQVVPDGHVVGVDVGEEQLGVARQHAAERGLANVTFRALSAEALGAVGEQFDLVYSRFLLVHLERPELALREMLACVKPGGVLASDEQELAAACCVPDSSAFSRSVDLVYQLARAKNLNFDYGSSTFGTFRALGCQDVSLRVVQPALTTMQTKRLWPQFFVEARASIADSGLVSAAELDDIIDGIEAIAADDDYAILAMRNHQVSGRRPAPGGPRP
jgi:ubiquinone/menaquinone biosynthesis C-methylase UbiE